MPLKSITELLSALPPGARDLAEQSLRDSGDLAAGAPLEDAFEQSRDYTDCMLDCQDAFSDSIDNCDTDECRAGAAIALRKCRKAC